ncbi:MAG: LEA type 2 family protein [Polyangiaceae bacterium]|nr:LEA type 2 family protein [Polyangiaceae bacterium]NUQ79900.1 LEA type 2 family protein [Polyangiaceae bacterium]
MTPARFAAPLLTALAITGCSGPEPPTLTPVSGTITSVSPTGLGLRVKLEAYNPNSFGLTTRDVTAKVTLDGRYDVGTVTMTHALELPAQKRTPLDIPVTMAWRDLAGLAGLAASGRDIPFAVEGTVALGGEKLNINVPFRITGTVTQKQLLQATIGSLPQIPGLPALGAPQ